MKNIKIPQPNRSTIFPSCLSGISQYRTCWAPAPSSDRAQGLPDIRRWPSRWSQGPSLIHLSRGKNWELWQWVEICERYIFYLETNELAIFETRHILVSETFCGIIVCKCSNCQGKIGLPKGGGMVLAFFGIALLHCWRKVKSFN